MSCQFKASDFSFNSINFSDKYGMYLVSIGSNNNDEIVNGQVVTIVDEVDTGDIKSFSKITREYVDIPITICKVKDNEVFAITDNELDEINMELFKSKYCPFEFNDLIVNCIAIKSNSFFNSAKQGYINLTLHCEPYCRSYIMTKEVVLRYGSKEIELINKSNIDEDLDVNIEIYGLGDGSIPYIEITNLTNGTRIKFENLSTDNEKHLIVYGESSSGVPMNYVESLVDNSYNLLNKMTVRKWIKLSNGINKISTRVSSNTLVRFSYQNKIMFK